MGAKYHPFARGGSGCSAVETGARPGHLRCVARAPDIEAYLVERRAVLLNPDIEVLRAHMVKWGRPDAATAREEVLRIAWHKARSAATDLPRQERRKSI